MEDWKIKVGLWECKNMYGQTEEEEMLPFLPRVGDVFWMSDACEDGFFVVEKGTKDVRCWCRVDRCVDVTMTDMAAVQYASVLGVSWSFVLNYAPIGKKVYMWQIGKVMELQDLCRDSLCIDKNPQQFAYCPLSYGESF